MTALDSHDLFPSGMREYISNYGFHFSRKAFEYAVSLMRNRNGEKVSPLTKDQIDDFLRRFGVEPKNKHGYDYAYAFHYGQSKFFNSSIIDEQRLALFVKDFVDNQNDSKETPFRQWLATMVGNGEPVDWEDII